MVYRRVLLWILLPVFSGGCVDTFLPKPKGYFRIDLPEKDYIRFDTTYPYSFEYNSFCIISPYKHDTFSEPYWINIDYPELKGTLFLSYKLIENNLSTLVNDSWEFVNKHIPMADAIFPNSFSNPEGRVYGFSFVIKGSGAASPVQFYASDSTNHFLRGALYFNVVPNNDSLKPVIEFIHKDIQHLLETLQWKL